MNALTDPKSQATITLSRYNVEVLMIRSIVDMSTTLIPLAHQLFESAIAVKAPPNSPQFMAAWALYFSVNDQRNFVLNMVQELAKDEPRYRDTMKVLWADGDPEVKVNAIEEIDVKLQQWRLNFQKFANMIDPSSVLLKVHHAFDADPPA